MSAPAISISNLRKHYEGAPKGAKKEGVATRREALAGIDMNIPAGAFFGLLGRNGAGKTSLIGLITGLVRMETGSISIFGFDNQRQAMAARCCVGLVPQEVNFNSFEPVQEIVSTQGMYYGLSRKDAARRACEVLELVGLADRARSKAWGLSGGLKRRLMIARALVHRPRLLMLDEPSAGLDVEARQATWAMLRELNGQGTTIFLTTHYLEEAEALCNDIAIIDAGRIIARDTPEVLLSGLQTQHLMLELADAPLTRPQLARGRVRDFDGHRLELDWPQHETLDQLFNELLQQGIKVLAVQQGSNRLESRFLELLAARASADTGRV
ncbi:ABC transporter ATP-binding protein [Allohahella sp. A8]|uniref:ABC transporter ATP-binding protein n=1 Tax=Allohahella sp. A8 TaxID=3141461 RepID=UPI003A80E108